MGVLRREEIERNFRQLKEDIKNICASLGADCENIMIVAVTKTFPPEVVQSALEAGITHIGENRIQEAEDKVDTVRRLKGRFHMIGHLQSNKAKKAVEMFDMIQSVDSIKIAGKIADEAAKRSKRMEILLQVNCSGEETKSGFDPLEMLEAAERIKALPGVEIKGIMTIGPFVDDESIIRRDFQLTRKLYDDIRSRNPDIDMKYLSMGMSADYHIALREGANMIRVGSVIFGSRPA
ncbi:MAG: YggS family pyridoxal phosphate-dependent enzyme [candidate division Zixibacteria bacterium]|nr:YggS family pyridoxal phosphate-dependent enzyme [candidate division Zixibacteria bacterium]